MPVPEEAYEQLLIPHGNLAGFSDSKGLCLSSIPKETASAHYLQTASGIIHCETTPHNISFLTEKKEKGKQ